MRGRSKVCLWLAFGLAVAGTVLPFAPAVRGQVRPGTGIERTLDEARARARRGDHEGAILLLDQLLAEFPGEARLHIERAISLLALERSRPAIKALERALRLDPFSVEGLTMLGRHLIEEGLDIPRGERLLRQALEHSPGYAPAMDGLGLASYRRGNLGQAGTHFEAALRSDPRLVSAHYHLGLLALKRADYGRARQVLTRLLELSPRHVKGHLSLAMAHEKLGDRARARQALLRALDIVGRGTPAGGEILRLLNQMRPVYRASALQHFLAEERPPISTPPTAPRPAPERQAERPDASRTAARVRTHSTPQPARAPTVPVIDFTRPPVRGMASPGFGEEEPGESQVLSSPEELARRHFRLARIYEDRGLPRDAVGELRTAINLSPGSEEARLARRRIPSLQSLTPASREQRLAAYLEVGEQLVSEGDLEGGRRQFQKVLLEQSDHPRAHKALAFVAIRKGRLKEASTHVEEALAAEPHYLEALLIRGYIQARLRQFEKSWNSFSMVADLARDDTALKRYALAMARKLEALRRLE